MSWFSPWDGLKTKTCRYLLQRYLGQFFENNLNLEQLKVDLYNGKAVVENINLKVNAFNDLFEEQGWAFEVVTGHIGCLQVQVPWNALMTNDSSLEISNLTITLRPVTRLQSGTTMLESMWSSVSSSMQMAEECMKQVDDDIPFLQHNNALIGLEKFAETIDNVLNRIRAKMTNTTLNVEYVMPGTNKKLVVSIKAEQMEYKNKTGYEQTAEAEAEAEEEEYKALPMIAKHTLVMQGLEIYTTETIDYEEGRNYEQLCKIGEIQGEQNIQIKIKQTENIIGPKVNLEVILDNIYLMVTPRQVHLFKEFSKGFDKEKPQEKKMRKSKSSGGSKYEEQSKMTGILGQNNVWSTEMDTYTTYSKSKSKMNTKGRRESDTISSCSTYLATEVGNNESSGEILKFNIQIRQINGLALNQEVLKASTEHLDNYGRAYDTQSFERYEEIKEKYFLNAKGGMKEGLPLENENYIYVQAQPLIILGDQQRYCQELRTKSVLSATQVDLMEVLENKKEHLILFNREKNNPEGYHRRAEVVLTQNSSYQFKQNHNRGSNMWECQLDECLAEMDVTIYDRLSNLFGSSPFEGLEEVYYTTKEDSLEEEVTEFLIKCDLLKMDLKFPLVDGRSNEDPLKKPWWLKNIRQDYLRLDLSQFCLSLKKELSLKAEEMKVSYCDESFVSKLAEAKNFQLKVLTNPYVTQELSKKHLTPFSSKCSYGYTSNVEGMEKSETFLPGETEELKEFCFNSSLLSKIKIEVLLTYLKVVLESKKMYELIYNRLNCDLLMWLPRSPYYDSETKPKVTEQVKRNELLSSSSMESSIYFSMAGPETHQKPLKSEAVSFEAFIEEGSLIINHFLNDSFSEVGKFCLILNQMKIFTVTGLNNEADLTYFCLQLQNIKALHSGLTKLDLNLDWSPKPDENLKLTLYPQVMENDNSSREVLSLVAEIKKQTENKIKRMKLSFGLNKFVLQHRSELTEHQWLNQLLDFLKVEDYPIEEYEPFALISEIQIHLWHAGIDYQPLHFPYRSFVDLGYATLSTNIISSLSGCTLRLLAEDCILKLAEQNSKHFVPLLNLGLMNVSFRLNDSKVDLRCSLHDLHLKTCYDSASILAQLIAYVAQDKDLEKLRDAEQEQLKSNPPQDNEATQKQVNKLLNEAVSDIISSDLPLQTTNCAPPQAGLEIFYFPDEPQGKSTQPQPSKSHSNSIGDIWDFETNVMLKSYLPSTPSLPQVHLDLGTPSTDLKDFDFIQEEEIIPMDKFGVSQIYIPEAPLQIVDNHFRLPHEKVDLLRAPSNFPLAEQSYTLCEMTFTWHLFGGQDFPSESKENPSSTSVTSKMSDTYKFGVAQSPTTPKKSQRNPHILVEIQLSKIRFSHELYPSHSLYASRQVLLISEIEIRDRLSTSDINKFLYHPSSKNISTRSQDYMLIVKALNVRPNPQQSPSEECSLRISILPIKLNIDQDTLLFLEDFFSSIFKNSSSTSSPPKVEASLPVLSVSQELQDFEVKQMVEHNLNVLIDESRDYPLEVEPEVPPVYFREVIFSPALPICFDYHGRRIELSRGPITGLIMGLAQLQGSGICLREIVNRRGILGWPKLFEFLFNEWLKDIKRNQLPNILSGIGPTNAVLQLFQGVYDLFRLPIQQYHKDGRLIRGFQLGAQSFTARTALAALEITSRIIHLLQFTAETTFDMLSAGPSLKKRHHKQGKKRQGRPKDLREGVANAYTIVKEGINESANTLIEAAITEHDQKGYSGAVGAVVRQIPQLVVCPAVLATQATTNILGGAKSSLIPEAKLEARDKWKHEIH